MKTSFDTTFDPPALLGTLVLREPKGGLRSAPISVQIDTGADISLLPKQLVSIDFILSDSRNRILVTGYDGSVREFETVRLQVVFAGIRFLGDFCLIDDNIGILGRDILNQLVLVIDGPSQTWEVISEIE